MEEFDLLESIDDETKNTVSTYSLLAIVSYGLSNLSDDVTLSLMEKAADVAYKERATKALNIYQYFKYLEEKEESAYTGFIGSFSGFSSLKDELKGKLNPVAISEADKENYSIILTAIVFGYSCIYNSVDDFWHFFNKNQIDGLHNKELLSRANLELIFDYRYRQLRLNILNSPNPRDSIIYLLKYIDVGGLFSGESINTALMKDSEIQSYRISGKVNYFYGFDPSIVDCEQIEVDGATGFRTYPCNRVSVKPRDLQFNQIITDGPYSSGGSSAADAGIALLTSIGNSRYDSSRLEEVELLEFNAYFAFYNSGWVFNGFPDFKKPVNLGGDVAFANNASSLKKFPDGAETGQFHFLGNYTFITGTGVGQTFDYKGFDPILLRLNNKDESFIYSGLEVNLFDKAKRGEQLMAYSISTSAGPILRSFDPETDSPRYPLLSINQYLPELPFIGINLDFSSRTFNKIPSARFNFGSLYYVPPSKFVAGGNFTRATDFSFTGFDMSGDYFGLSKGSIKFNKEIKNTDNFNPEEHFVNETNENGKVLPQSGGMLLQKALGFSNYEDCITGIEHVKTGNHYGVEYKFIEGFTPPQMEAENVTKLVGDSGVLKYVTGIRSVGGEVSSLLTRRVFGPLESKTDQGLDGKDFDYKYLPADYESGKLAYRYAPALNPARYYSGLFASERRTFLYQNAKKIHARNKYFPSQVRLSFKVEEEYSKSANGSLSRYGANVEKTIGELNGYWVDQDFSHYNFQILVSNGSIPCSAYNPLTNRNLNSHFQYLTGDVSISDGKLNQENLTAYYFIGVEQAGAIELHLPNTPLNSSLKESYSFDMELNYTLPIKSLSDFKNYPGNSNRSFVSTGDSKIVLYGGVIPEPITGWTEEINKQVNNGADPLFNPGPYDHKGLDDSENLSADSWNGLYIRSGAVSYSPYSPPFRLTELDKIFVQASDDSSAIKLFLRNLKLFPTFVNNDQDKSYGSGQSFVEDSFSSERQRSNLIDQLRVFEINAASIFDKIPNDYTSFSEMSSFTKSVPLNIPIEKNILRTGKLYYAPELVNQSVSLPEVSAKEYKQITDLYPQLNSFTFYSGVDAYSKANKGYRIEYKESSNLKLTITSAEIKYDRFPASDELFEFHLTGGANFSGELSYVTQEESCVITHGVKIEERVNDLDKFQPAYRFSNASPILKEKLGSVSTFSFPTRQIRRRNKVISGKNTFANVNGSSPDYNNHFHVPIVPEYVHFAGQSSILGSFSQDHLLHPSSSIINSSSYDYSDTFANGEEYKMSKIDKVYDVVESKRFYDAYFTDSMINSGKFIEFLPTGASLNSNKECKSFFADNFSKISDLELGEEGNIYITKMEDRSSDVSKLRSSMMADSN